MLKRNTVFSIKILVVLPAISLLFCGCIERSKKPATISGGSAESPQQSQAVDLYVDALALNDINEHQRALEKLNMAIEQSPDFAIAISLRGDIYRTLKRYEESADSYEAATRIDPYSFKDFLNLGKVSLLAGNFQRALDAYIEAVELQSQNIEANIGAAKCYYQLKDYTQAIEYASRAKEIDPKNSAPEMVIADTYSAMRDYIAAIDSYKRALQIEGPRADILVPLAFAYANTRDFAQAAEILNATIEIDPNNSLAHQYLGFVNITLLKPDLAMQSYLRAIAIDDNDWEAHKGLGVAYIMQYRKNESDLALRDMGISEWKRSLEINPDQPQVIKLITKYSP